MKKTKLFSFIAFTTLLLGAGLIAKTQDSTETYRPYNMQNDNKPSFFDRLVFGGNLGLQFGTETIIDISPVVGYKITEKLIGGVGAKYLYYKTELLINGNLYKYSTNIYGGSVFGRYYLTPEFYAHTEYEILNLEVPDDFVYGKLVRRNITSFLVGGGYRQPLGDRASIGITLLYNLTEDRYSPYQNPILRVGFGFGF